MSEDDDFEENLFQDEDSPESFDDEDYESDDSFGEDDEVIDFDDE